MADNIKEKIEDKVIDLIVSGALSRLVVFKPENLTKDLIVEKRGDYKKRVIALDIRGVESFDKGIIEKEISQLEIENNFKAEENFYLVFVHFDAVKQEISDNFLIIPSVDLQKEKVLISKQDFVRFLIESFA